LVAVDGTPTTKVLKADIDDHRIRSLGLFPRRPGFTAMYASAGTAGSEVIAKLPVLRNARTTIAKNWCPKV